MKAANRMCGVVRHRRIGAWPKAAFFATLAAAAIAAAFLIVPSAQARAATPPGFFGLNYAFKDITSGDVLMLKKSGAKTCLLYTSDAADE